MIVQVQEYLAQREGRTCALSLASFASMEVAVDGRVPTVLKGNYKIA